MNEIIDPRLFAVARKNFWTFCYCWDKSFFNDRRPFLYDIAEQFQRIADKEIERLSVSMPPRAGKSYITSLFCAWMIGNNPEGSVMRNSATARLYNKFSRAVRGFIKDPRYKSVFPEIKLSDDNQGVESWSIDQALQVSYFGDGVGGSIVGEGVTLVAITDDLYRGHKDALSETVNETTHTWYDSDHVSRMEGDCPQIDIGTRWSTTDVIGKNIEDGFYDVSIIVPALINDKTFCHDVKSTEKYFDIKARIDQFLWNSEYMQQPVQLEGIIFPDSELKTWDEFPTEGIDVCFVDTKDTGLDHYSCPFARISGDKIYVHDAVFNQYNLTQNEPIIISRMELHGTHQSYIESNNAGAYHIRTLRKMTDIPIRSVNNTLNKMLRILAESGYIINNFYFPKVSPSAEYDRFYHQLTTLLKTGTKNDDAADSLAGLSRMIRREFIR